MASCPVKSPAHSTDSINVCQVAGCSPPHQNAALKIRGWVCSQSTRRAPSREKPAQLQGPRLSGFLQHLALRKAVPCSAPGLPSEVLCLGGNGGWASPGLSKSPVFLPGRPGSWMGVWEEEADSWALESLPPLPHCSPSGQQPPPLPQDKGPSVCSAPRQTAGLSLPLPLEWSALTMTPPCPLQRAWHTPLCTNLFLLKDPETKAGKPGVGAGPVCWVKPSAIPSCGRAAQARRPQSCQGGRGAQLEARAQPRWT